MIQPIPFETGKGTAQVSTHGNHVELTLSQGDDRKGLYKGYLRGKGGRMELGTLMPEGGQLVLRRNLSCATLEHRGLWPILGVGTCLAYVTPPVRKMKLSPSWQKELRPHQWIANQGLSHHLQSLQGSLMRSRGEFIELALPWNEKDKFPIPPLFCLATAKTINGQPHFIFAFHKNGSPMLPVQE